MIALYIMEFFLGYGLRIILYWRSIMSSYRCLVLLATYNGSQFIKEQLDSILKQGVIDVHIVVSDDMSDDNTLKIIKSYQSDKITVLPNIGRMGSASQNFFRLVRDAPVENFNYIAFADQDDIWEYNKLSTAIVRMRAEKLDAYSSNVMAFWDNGREVLIDKSSGNKRYDYLFSSAGPGCTYVFTRSLLEEFKAQLLKKEEVAKSIKLHDWLIYAFARRNNCRWLADDVVGMRYRQHDSNEFGANSGLKAVRDRWKKARGGWYRQQILLVADFCEVDNAIVTKLRRNTYWDRLTLLYNVFQFRKKKSEAIFLALVWLIPGFR